MLGLLGLIAAMHAVRVDVAGALGATSVEPNFVGLSIEVGAVLHMIGATGNSTALAMLLGGLHNATEGSHAGPTLRLGGNSADDSCWHTEAPAHGSNCTYAIGPADLEAYLAFASTTAAAANVSYIIDTNFGLSPDPHAVAVPHVAAVLGTTDGAGRRLIDRTLSFEVGNEIDLFHDAGKPGRPLHRNSSYSEAEYEVEFKAFVAAYIDAGLAPDGMVQGATYASTDGEWGAQFAEYLAANARALRSVSLHQYCTSVCHNKTVTSAELLADSTIRGHVDALRPYIADAQRAGIPFVVGEGNSASCGGQRGVSDTLAATLWALAYLPRLSQAGVEGMNFHGGPNGEFSGFDLMCRAVTLYYYVGPLFSPLMLHTSSLADLNLNISMRRGATMMTKGAYAAIAFNSSGALEVRPLYYALYLFTHFVANHSRWRAANVSALPPSPAPAPGPSADPYCTAGIKGSSSTCCAARCGVCGGDGCDQRPGGAADCCGHTIAMRNASCDTHRAPCVIDGSLPPPTSAVVAFAASSRTATKVLIVAKTSRGFPTTDPIAVCAGAPSVLGAVGSTGELWVLAGTEGIATSATRGTITLAGRTLQNSTTGEWRGTARPLVLHSRADGAAPGACFDVALPPYAAAMLVVQTNFK